MRIPLLITLVLVCAGASAGAHAADADVSAQRQIQQVWRGMVSAAKAHDTDRFMSAYLREPGLVFVFNGHLIHGWDDLHAQQLKWWQNGKSDVVYTEVGKTHFMPLGAHLWVTTSHLVSHRTLAGGKISEASLMVTSIWKKLPQGWRIVYGHESTDH